MSEIPNCTTCGKLCTDRFNDPSIYFYEANPFCGRCYHSMVCVYCDPPVVLAKCEGHGIQKNPNNRFMRDKEFLDGMRFEVEGGAPKEARPLHVPTKR